MADSEDIIMGFIKECEEYSKTLDEQLNIRERNEKRD